MSSPVNERRYGSRLNGMIVISLVFHVVILALLFFTPSFPSPKLTFGPVYTVSLVSLSGAVQEPRGASSAARELVRTSRPETVLKKSAEAIPEAPIRTLETRKKRDKDIDKAIEEIRRRAAAADATKRPQAKGPPENPAGSPPQPGAAEMNAQMRAYYATIWSRIKGRWVMAQGTQEVLEAVIDVTILRSGAVADLSYEKRSGNAYFDESAMRAIRKASPFPPLPAGMGDSSIQVGIRFHSSELKP